MENQKNSQLPPRGDWDNSYPKFIFLSLTIPICIFILQSFLGYNNNLYNKIAGEERALVNMSTSMLMGWGLMIIILKDRLPSTRLFIYKIMPTDDKDRHGSFMNKSSIVKNYIIGFLLFLLGAAPLIIFWLRNNLI